MRVALALALLAAGTVGSAQNLPPDLPPGAPAGAGPRGTSGEVREDTVGYAEIDPRVGDGVAVLHPRLPQGSFVELTALDTGRTIAAIVAGPYNGRAVVVLTPAAAQALGVSDGAGVRVRSVTPTPQEQAALRSRQSVGARLDAPQTLLVALRRKLPGRGTVERRAALPATRAAPVRAEPAPRAAPAPTATRGRYGVQVATLSAADRAEALARALSGHVVAAGRLYRVQLGPFPDANSAARARDGAARAGYRDARVFSF